MLHSYLEKPFAKEQNFLTIVHVLESSYPLICLIFQVLFLSSFITILKDVMLIGKVTVRHIRSLRARKWVGREKDLSERRCLKILHRYSPSKTKTRKKTYFINKDGPVGILMLSLYIGSRRNKRHKTTNL